MAAFGWESRFAIIGGARESDRSDGRGVFGCGGVLDAALQADYNGVKPKVKHVLLFDSVSPRGFNARLCNDE